jgi:Ca-activated chloride channel family protein
MILRFPWLLALLPLAVAAAWVRARLAPRTGIPFSHGAALRDLPTGWAVRARRVLPLLHGAGLCLVILALARPQRGLESFRSEADVVDIVLLLDVSTSMRAEDFSAGGERMNRLEAARRVAREFVKARERDRLGLIVFSALPYTLSPLTMDHGFLLGRMDEARPGMIEDGTAIGTAVASAVNRLRDSAARSKVIVLLTDGMNNLGSVTPETAAQAAKAMGIRMHVVGAASEGDAPFPVQDPFGGQRYVRQRSDIDDAQLGRLAEQTGGVYFRATDFHSLKKVYEQIDTMERTEVETERFLSFEERFFPFLAAGLLLLALERALALGRLSVLEAAG